MEEPPAILAPDASQALLASIAANLGAMERASLRTVLLAVVALWLGLAEGHEATFRIFDVRVPMDRSAWALAVVLSASTLELAFRLLRVTAALESLDALNAGKGILALWSHPWLFNPLTWNGHGRSARFAGAVGVGLSLGPIALSMAAVFSLGLLGDRAASAVAACMTAGAGVVFARAAVRASIASDRAARRLGDDPFVGGAPLSSVSAAVARRVRVFFALVAAGFALTVLVSAWWVTAG